MEQATGQISCLLIPVQNKNLLLPNAAVAEIVDYQTPESSEETPDWFLGYVYWRGIRLPLISYDQANESGSGEFAVGSRIAVTNTIGKKHKQLPFMAFVTQGLPRLMKVRNEEISAQTDASVGAADSVTVKVNGEDATIPNLEHMEELALEALATY